jgi:multidrug resistance efflux pump
MANALKRNLFYIVLALSGLAAIYGYSTWRLDPLLVGTVELRLHPIGAREGGLIAEITVETGSQVRAGQTLVLLDASDLHLEQQYLEQQQASLEQTLAADRQRHALEYDLLRLRVSQQSAAAQADLAELEALNQEIHSLEEAEAAGLGRDRGLARLQIRRDALRQTVAAQATLVQERNQAKLGEPTAVRDSVLISLLGDRTDRLHEIRRRLALIEQRLEARIVRAPCAGRVVEITVRTGTSIDAYRPILTIEDPQVSYVEVYLPEAQDRAVMAGQLVEVYSRRSDQFNTTGHIRFVHPGFTAMPERLWLRGQPLWARKMQIELAPDHALLPGESVQARLLPGQGTAASAAKIPSPDDSALAAKSQGRPASIKNGIQQQERQEQKSHAGSGS